MNGVLVIDKPVGPTSHDVVARCRRALREKRIGHTGTLDPLASGVLPLVIGRATRLASILSSSEKEYEAAIRLGAATDTYDAAERLASGAPPPAVPPVTPAQVEGALETFRGTFPQMPPPFSAKKVGGVRAYKLARKEKPTSLTAVPVTVHRLDFLGLESGLVRLRVVASAGFYVRSLAHDLGVRLGCGAHLETLRRTRAGRFGLVDAVPLDEVERDPAAAVAALVPLENLAPELPAVRLTERGARRAAHGNYLSPEDIAETMSVAVSGRVRVFDPEGQLLAIADAGADGLLRPSIVLV